MKNIDNTLVERLPIWYQDAGHERGRLHFKSYFGYLGGRRDLEGLTSGFYKSAKLKQD